MNGLFKDSKDHILIAAHRGECGGNIPFNTLASYGIGLRQGADIIELDVDRLKDGTLVVFHPSMERYHLGYAGRLRNIDKTEASYLRYLNGDQTQTQFSLNTLDEAFSFLKGKCYINVDKFWENPEHITKKIREYSLEDKAIIKCSCREKYIADVEKYAPDLMFMPVVSTKEELDYVLSKNVNCVGAEVCFDTEDHPFANDGFIEYIHDKGLLLWVNAIVYNYRTVLAAGHSDDASLIGDPADGWGWIADKGYDIIQTDWAMMCIDYLKKAGKYYKNI